MVYFDNTTESQRVFIPRTDIQASAYHPSTGGTEQYYAGNNIEITPTNVINVTGLTEAIETTVSGMTLNYATTGDVETMISAATSDFVTSGDVQSQITSQTQNFVTSGDVETMVSGFTTTGEVETMITSATSGLASTQYVENAVSGKADTSAVTQTLSSYTPTENFATINGSGITSGGNIVIESGGDSTTLEKITTLPTEPVDGAVYNYNGVLVRYVNGAGDWGKWYGINVTNTYSYKSNVTNTASLNYAVLPVSVDGQLLCSCRYFTSNYLYIYFDIQNDCLNVYTDSANTATTAYVINHNGAAVTMELSTYQRIIGSWIGNRILLVQSNGGSYSIIENPCVVSASTAHYELVDTPTPVMANIDKQKGVIPIVAENGLVEGYAYDVNSTNINLNGSYKNLIVPGTQGALGTYYAPSTSGATGTLCVAQGNNTAPVWKTIAQALGVDFWVGTDAEYQALSPNYSNTTLYFIKET